MTLFGSVLMQQRDSWESSPADAAAEPRYQASPRAANVVAAGATFAAALMVYVATLTPGLSWSDWGEAQWAAARLGIMHPTGYPVYTLLGWLFSFLPIDSIPYRVNLASATYAST